MITLLVMTDGRDDLLARSIESINENIQGPITHRVIHDDTGSAQHNTELTGLYSDFSVIGGTERRGFSGAYHEAWNHVSGIQNQYVFGTEDDFTYNNTVDLNEMMRLLEEQPYLAQVALLRQAWNEEEIEAGGLIQLNREDFTFRSENGLSWVEHRKFFTTNPSLYPMEIVNIGWPNVENSEGIFSIGLFQDYPKAKSSYWGDDATPWVHHIGEERIGTGY